MERVRCIRVCTVMTSMVCTVNVTELSDTAEFFTM